MTLAHLHLLVNHVPILGTVLAVPLLILALVGPDRARGSVVPAATLLVLAGVGAAAAYWTGEEAEHSVEELALVSERMIGVHEERAELAAIATGVLALAGAAAAARELVRRDATPRSVLVVLLAATVAVHGLMAWTGAAGGAIRRPELRGEPAPTRGELPAALGADEDDGGHGRGRGRGRGGD